MMHEVIETNREAGVAPHEISETQARAYLDKIHGERPSIRALATEWGWHRSKVERLLRKIEPAAPTAPEIDLTDYPTIQAAQQRGAREASFNAYDPKERCLVVPRQFAIACYINTSNCVVIRQEDPNDTDDDMIVVDRMNLPKVIRALQELEAELRDIAREEEAQG